MQSKEPIDFKPRSFQDLIDGLQAQLVELNTWTERYKEADEMRGDVKCEKCSEDLGYGWDAARQRMKLAGEIYAVLCTSCVNLWGDHLRIDASAGKDAYADLRVNDAETDATRLCYDTQGKQVLPEAKQALIELVEKRLAIIERLRVVAKEWLAIKLPAPITVTP